MGSSGSCFHACKGINNMRKLPFFTGQATHCPFLGLPLYAALIITEIPLFIHFRINKLYIFLEEIWPFWILLISLSLSYISHIFKQWQQRLSSTSRPQFLINMQIRIRYYEKMEPCCMSGMLPWGRLSEFQQVRFLQLNHQQWGSFNVAQFELGKSGFLPIHSERAVPRE